MRCITIIFLTMLFVVPVMAVPIDVPRLSDTFDGRASGALTATGGWSTVDPASLKNKRKVEVAVDSGNLLGRGVTNKVLFFQNIAGDPVAYDTAFGADNLNVPDSVLKLSLDFYEPSTVSGGMKISVGGTPGAANPVNLIVLADGAIQPAGTYSVDAAHHLDVVYNETGASLDYDDPAGGVSSLGTGLMDIWIDQVRVAAGSSNGRAGSPSPQLSSIHFANDGTTQEIYLDTIQLYTVGNGVVPPEPAPALTITNLLLSSNQVSLEWNQSPERFIVVASDRVDGMAAHGQTVVSSTVATNRADFAYSGNTGFFRVQSGIAAVDGISSAVLRNEVKTQSIADAPTNRIYDTELDGITGMTLPASEIAIPELMNFYRLEKLSLAGSSMSGLGDLSAITNLTWLNLSNNRLTDVSALGTLSKLEALNLESNLVSSLSGIEGLQHLRWLDLENNQVADLSLVVTNAANGGLGNGDALWVRGNPLSALATNQIQTLENVYNVKVYF